MINLVDLTDKKDVTMQVVPKHMWGVQPHKRRVVMRPIIFLILRGSIINPLLLQNFRSPFLIFAQSLQQTCPVNMHLSNNISYFFNLYEHYFCR